MKCPECNYESERNDFRLFFCPHCDVEEDECSGCEIDSNRYTCPECDIIWDRD